MDLQASLHIVLEQGTQFSESFYQRLADDHPDVFAHFEGINMKHQAHMLNNSLLLCVQEGQVPSESLRYYLRILGTKHNQRKVERDAYALWTNTMLSCLERWHGDQWSPDLATEWRAALETATREMFAGYDEPFHM